MDAKKCDRCGNFYTQEEQNSIMRDSFEGKEVMAYISTFKYESTGIGRFVDMDFCPECKKELSDLIRAFLKKSN